MLMNPRNLRLHLPITENSTNEPGVDADPLLGSRRTPRLIPAPPPLPSPPSPISVLLINLLVVVSPSLSSAVPIRLQLYLEEVGSWRLTAKGFPLSPAVGQWNYEHSSQSLYRPVLKLFVFRTQRNLTEHGDWSLRSLGFSLPPGKTDEMCACVRDLGTISLRLGAIRRSFYSGPPLGLTRATLVC